MSACLVQSHGGRNVQSMRAIAEDVVCRRIDGESLPPTIEADEEKDNVPEAALSNPRGQCGCYPLDAVAHKRV